MSPLRSYTPMSKRSRKVEEGEAEYQAVYDRVDARSEGRCEVSTVVKGQKPERCPRRGVEHHHLFKPRRSHHTEEEVVHACRVCHDRMEWPYKRGRLCYVGRLGAAFLFVVRTSASKFAARGQG